MQHLTKIRAFSAIPMAYGLLVFAKRGGNRYGERLDKGGPWLYKGLTVCILMVYVGYK
jgi:hypothetical protein